MIKFILFFLLIFNISFAEDVVTVNSGESIYAAKINEIINKLNLLSAENEILKTQIVPVGTVISFAGICPSGYFSTDGGSKFRSLFPKLFTAIGVAHGTTDASSFNIPDYRGRFLRSVSDSSNLDPDKMIRTQMNPCGATGNNVGSIQSDQFAGHAHNLASSGSSAISDNLSSGNYIIKNPNGNTNYFSYAFTGTSTPATFGLSSTVGGNENRPKNAYVNFCIKHD